MRPALRKLLLHDKGRVWDIMTTSWALPPHSVMSFLQHEAAENAVVWSTYVGQFMGLTR